MISVIILVELIHFGILFFLGYILRLITKPPPHFRYALVLATAFVNCGDMPLAIVLTIGLLPPFGKGDVENGVAYISIYAMVMTLFFWLVADVLVKIENEKYLNEDGTINYTLGPNNEIIPRDLENPSSFGNYLDVNGPSQDDTEKRRENSLDHSGGDETGEMVASERNSLETSGTQGDLINMVDLEESKMLSRNDGGKKKYDENGKGKGIRIFDRQYFTELEMWRRKYRTVRLGWTLLTILFSPPNTGSWFGLLVGFTPALKHLFVTPVGCEVDCGIPPLKFVYDTVYLVGYASVPLNIMIMGGAIQKNPIKPLLGYPITLGLSFIKLAIMPTLGFTMVYIAAYVLGWIDPTNKMLIFVLILQSAMPTAQLMISVQQRHRSTGIEMASVMFLQYILVIVTLPIVMSIVLYTVGQ